MALDGKEPLKETEAWSSLQSYFNENKNTIDMKKMFDEDDRRFDKFSIMLETPKDVVYDVLLIDMRYFQMRSYGETGTPFFVSVD